MPKRCVWSSPVFFMMTSRSSISEGGSWSEWTNLSRISLRANGWLSYGRVDGVEATTCIAPRRLADGHVDGVEAAWSHEDAIDRTLSRGPRALVVVARKVHRYGLSRRLATRPLCKLFSALLDIFYTKRPRMKGNMTQATPEVVSQRYINGSIHEYVGQPGEGAAGQPA